MQIWDVWGSAGSFLEVSIFPFNYHKSKFTYSPWRGDVGNYPSLENWICTR